MGPKFIESICFNNGTYSNLDLHQKRINRTFGYYFDHPAHQLVDVLPKIDWEGKFKVRMIYDAETVDIEYSEYLKRAIRSLEVIHTEPFDYSFKYMDREAFNSLLKNSTSDDIILCMDGLIKDSSYANLCFYDDVNWWTPNTPLLNGIKRQKYLYEGVINEKKIGADEVTNFQKVSLINAMLDLGEIELSIDQVRL